jgi:hypothetical protein
LFTQFAKSRYVGMPFWYFVWQPEMHVVSFAHPPMHWRSTMQSDTDEQARSASQQPVGDAPVMH